MKEHMMLAIRKAMSGVRKGESPFGACIVKGKKVIAVTHNTVLSKRDSTNHAEINAIRLACRRMKSHKLEGCAIYSTTEPCPMCFSAIHWAGISRIVFGTRIADVADLGFSELPISDETMKRQGRSPVRITGDFMREENLELLRFWKERKGRVY